MKQLFLAILGAVGVAGAGYAQQLEVTPAQMRGAAAQAVGAGQSALALDLSRSLLARDANDLAALLIQSRAQRNLGQHKAAVASAKRAWSLAQTETDRFQSALLVAQALSTAGKRTQAQFWLRRAAQHAPTPQLRQVALRDFRYVRARNKWDTQLSFNISPTSNINNGSSKSEVYYDFLGFSLPLSGDARALSGTKFSAGLTTRYRFSQSQSHATDIGFQLLHNTYAMSREAKAIAPLRKGSDFAFTYSALSLQHQVRPDGATGPLTVSAALGQSWYGGQPYQHFGRLGVSKEFRTSAQNLFRLSLHGEKQIGSGTAPDTDIWAANGDYFHRLGSGAQIQLSLGLRESNSDNIGSDYRSVSGSLGYTLAEPVLGARTTVTASFGQSEYGSRRYSADGRTDRRVSAGIEMSFDAYDYYGFAPTMSLSHTQADSNIDRYDIRETGIEFGVRSLF